MVYKYITEDNLENKQTYMYSEYGGEDFLEEYVKSRKDIIINTNSLGRGAAHNAYTELRYIWNDIRNAETIDVQTKDMIDMYVKAFEVRKRIYTGYDEAWKPCRQEYREYGIYLLLGNILIRTYWMTGCIKYVSCLMKLTDSLISVAKMLKETEQYELAEILEKELKIYEKLQRTGDAV